MHTQFLADILEHPADDTPRLIYADWLQDNGQLERGEFVRVQCELAKEVALYGEQGQVGPTCTCRQCVLRRREGELLRTMIPYVDEQGRAGQRLASYMWAPHLLWKGNDATWDFRRGFVSSIACPLAAWVGERCQMCSGQGAVQEIHHAPGDFDTCLVCRGSGITGRHGPRLVRCCPLEVVRLSDREPAHFSAPSMWAWMCYPGDHYAQAHSTDHLPENLFRHLPPESFDRQNHCVFPTRQAAEDALSAACLQWARYAAELENVRAELARPLPLREVVPGAGWIASSVEHLRAREAELARLVG